MSCQTPLNLESLNLFFKIATKKEIPKLCHLINTAHHSYDQLNEQLFYEFNQNSTFGVLETILKAPNHLVLTTYADNVFYGCAVLSINNRSMLKEMCLNALFIGDTPERSEIEKRLFSYIKRTAKRLKIDTLSVAIPCDCVDLIAVFIDANFKLKRFELAFSFKKS